MFTMKDQLKRTHTTNLRQKKRNTTMNLPAKSGPHAMHLSDPVGTLNPNCMDCQDMIKGVSQPYLKIENDPVNHPAHYTSDPSGIECIQITRHRNFNIGNAIKYIWRCGLKDGADLTEDIDKAIWYLQDEKARLFAESQKPKPKTDPYISRCGWCGNDVGSLSRQEQGTISHNNTLYHNGCFRYMNPEQWAKYMGVSPERKSVPPDYTHGVMGNQGYRCLTCNKVIERGRTYIYRKDCEHVVYHPTWVCFDKRPNQ